VTLHKGSEILEKVEANNYGDFKIDCLEKNSGEYSLEIEYKGYNAQKVKVDLKNSVSIGTVLL
jgi:hypothetical protein